ncbi:hypothetical protein Hanom_Chr14g01309081 [Helianthus anomalus]
MDLHAKPILFLLRTKSLRILYYFLFYFVELKLPRNLPILDCSNSSTFNRKQNNLGFDKVLQIDLGMSKVLVRSVLS